MLTRSKRWMDFLILGCLLVVLSSRFIYAQVMERWVYTYNGSGDGSDQACSIVYGADGNIYTAGTSAGSGTNKDFTVISLDALGNERWDWITDGGASLGDGASSIVCGEDGNMYVAGSIIYEGTNRNIAVVSLDTAGITRWTYMYDGEGLAFDSAHCIVYGADGNIYVAGTSNGSGTGGDFIAISFDSEGVGGNGYKRWDYTYNGNASLGDKANSIVYGADGNLYAAGQSVESGYDKDFTVVSIDTSGEERWIYTYEGASEDVAYSIIYGTDGNIYTAGQIRKSATSYDFTVISIDPTLGDTNWVYTYDGGASSADIAYSLIFGADENIYAAGYSYADTIHKKDFTVISLDTSGNQRWIYTYNGPGNHHDEAKSIVFGADGNIYAAGYIRNSGTKADDFTVISLDTLGSQRWVYTYNGSSSGIDRALSVVYGIDGNIYAAGYSLASTGYDFTVISLDPTPGVEEHQSITNQDDKFVLLSSFFNKAINIRFTTPSSSPLDIALYNVLGVRVYEISIPYTPLSVRLDDSRISRLSNGVYFLSASRNENVYPVKKLIKF